MLETGSHHPEKMKKSSVTTEANNDPAVYAEFMSSNGWRTFLQFWRNQKHLKSKTQKTYKETT